MDIGDVDGVFVILYLYAKPIFLSILGEGISFYNSWMVWSHQK